MRYLDATHEDFSEALVAVTERMGERGTYVGPPDHHPRNRYLLAEDGNSGFGLRVRLRTLGLFGVFSAGGNRLPEMLRLVEGYGPYYNADQVVLECFLPVCHVYFRHGFTILGTIPDWSYYPPEGWTPDKGTPPELLVLTKSI